MATSDTIVSAIELRPLFLFLPQDERLQQQIDPLSSTAAPPKSEPPTIPPRDPKKAKDDLQPGPSGGAIAAPASLSPPGYEVLSELRPWRQGRLVGTTLTDARRRACFTSGFTDLGCAEMTVRAAIRKWFGDVIKHEHHRYHSWEHCYRFFQETGRAGLDRKREPAALQLGFFLASWGMYRGSSFLLGHSYMIHAKVIDVLRTPEFARLWRHEFGSRDGVNLSDDVLALFRAVKRAYRPHGEPTDTLATKVILGTVGCLPACDKYFLTGFMKEGYSYSYVNAKFVDRVLSWCRLNLLELQSEQAAIERQRGIRYPLMKLVDMYFYTNGGGND